MRWCLLPALLALLLSAGCSRNAPVHELVEPAGEELVFPLAVVGDGGVHFYTCMLEGGQVNFFFRTDGEGSLHAHYDACYSCFKYRMGYRVEEDAVVCRACVLSFALAEPVWDFIGPCAPISLPLTLRGDSAVIALSRLSRGRKFF